MRRNPSLGRNSAFISAAPRLLVMKIMRTGEIHSAVVAQCQRRFVQNAEQEIPEGVASFFDFVEQHQAQLHGPCGTGSGFLAESGMGLAMSQISGRRADQLGDFMAVLELRAVDLDDRPRIPEQASAVASTIRVLPEPVGPRNRKLPIGRPTGDNPAR